MLIFCPINPLKTARFETLGFFIFVLCAPNVFCQLLHLCDGCTNGTVSAELGCVWEKLTFFVDGGIMDFLDPMIRVSMYHEIFLLLCFYKQRYSIVILGRRARICGYFCQFTCKKPRYIGIYNTKLYHDGGIMVYYFSLFF